MKILSIDTSCDETATAVTDGTKILSNIIWSQASAHAKFGGVMPSLAQRMHKERIDFIVDKALSTANGLQITDIDAIAVTVGPGLSIALGVGIAKAKELAKKYNKPLIAVNHVEAHLLSSFANNEYLISSIKYPALGLVVSGGNTQLIQINKVGDYKILAETQDDALGEALDKAARMLGLGYPGGSVLEKMSRLGNQKRYSLPIPLIADKIKNRFSYSGIKTAMMRLVESEKLKNKNGVLTKQDIYDLAACYQNVAFEHILKVVAYQISNLKFSISSFLLGGGVSNNILLRSKLRKLLKIYNIKLYVSVSKKLTGDNAAMIGVAAYFKAQRGEFINPEEIDRVPNLKL